MQITLSNVMHPGQNLSRNFLLVTVSLAVTERVGLPINFLLIDSRFGVLRNMGNVSRDQGNVAKIKRKKGSIGNRGEVKSSLSIILR